MPYDINEDPYVDKSTGVLKNRIKASTDAALNRAEAEITYVAIATLTQGTSVQGLRFDSNLLCDIHKEIFRDIYSWAGKFRRYDISKEAAYFCHVSYIPQEMERLSNELSMEDTSKFREKDYFLDRLTYYYSEYNAIHPFREGNGRAVRTFLRLYALKHGYDIEWANMDPDENIKVSQESLGGNTTSLRQMLKRLITKLDL